MTSSAFSAGLLLKTDDGGATWTELPELPSANGFRFVTPQDGWTTAIPDGHELWATHDGGRTWQQHMISPPSNCSGCWSNYQNPVFQNSKEALIDVTFSDRSTTDGVSVDCTYATHDGGNSWQATENCGQPIVNPPVDFVVRVNMHILRLSVDKQLVDRLRGIESPSQSNQTPVASGRPSIAIKGFSPPQEMGSIGGASFVNDSDGWLLYGFEKCTRLPNRATDGPGLPCLEMIQRTDLLATTDGGKTFTVITPPNAPAR